MKKIYGLLFTVLLSVGGHAQYCMTAGPSSTFDSNIGSVSITGSYGTGFSYTGCPGVTGVEDSTATHQVTLTPGGAYSLNVTFSSCGGNYSGAGEAWIDFDGNQVFDPSESLGTWSGLPTQSVTFNFTVPTNATPGFTRMRVMQHEGGSLPLNPCGTFTWGSVVDFGVMIQVINSPYNVAAINLSTTTGMCGLSPSNVLIDVVNASSDTILSGDTLTFGYVANNGASVSELYIPTTNFLPGDTIHYTFNTSFTPIAGTNTVQGWVNYLSDTLLLDDSLQISFFARPQITQFPYVEDFENGTGGWMAINGSNGTWELNNPLSLNGAYSGNNSWVTNAGGSYNNNDNSWVESPCFDLSQLCNPVVDFYINYDIESCCDGAALQASTDGGATWITIGQQNDPYNWYNYPTPRWAGTSNGWVNVKHDLNAVAGQSSVIFRIAFSSDGSVTYNGFAFDNFTISEAGQIAQNTMMHCGQDSVQLSVYASPTASIQWSTGDTTASIYVYNSGTYSVLYSDTNACPAGIDTVEVYMVAMPITVNLGNDTNICDGASITLDAGIPYSTYNWSTGDTTQTITTSQPGGYMVVVTNDCGTAYDNIQVGINPLPAVNLGMDSIVDQGYVLDAGAGFTSYLWNNGATTQTITVLNSGDYSVTVTDANGCSNSDTISLWITGIEELAAQFGAKVYPNPSQGQFTIQLPNNRVELTATITDMTGKAVYSQILANQTTYQINLTGLAKGVYFLNLSDGQKSVTQKLIIK